MTFAWSRRDSTPRRELRERRCLDVGQQLAGQQLAVTRGIATRRNTLWGWLSKRSSIREEVAGMSDNNWAE